MANRDDVEATLVERAQRDPEFRARLLASPRDAIAEALAVDIPADLTIRVVEEQPGEAVLVVPGGAPGSEDVGDAELAAVAGGSGASWCGHTQCPLKCGGNTLPPDC